MFKTFATAAAISGLMVSGALAQTTAPQQPAPPAATQTMPATPAPSATAPSTAPKFLASQANDQWLASRFRGTDVMGPNNEKIGDVNDILFDKDGRVLAVVVGVGGFLGIGQKDVAIDLSAFQVEPADARDNAATTGSATAPAPTTTTGEGKGMTMAGAIDPNNVRLKVAWTREQIEQAPSFERYKAPATTTGGAPATRR